MIDTHAHLFLCQRPLEELIQNAKKAGIIRIINPSVDQESWIKAKAQQDLYPEYVYATPGIYPGKDKDTSFLNEIELLAKNKAIVAIGEIGLDQFRVTMDIKKQLDTFEAQMDIANRTQTPVIIHNRHADEAIIQSCNRYPTVKKVFHCFGSGLKHIDALLNENAYFSFTATITYGETGKAIQGLKYLPIDRIMLETDSPYLTPRIFGKVENQPSHAKEIAACIAKHKALPLEEVLTITTQNALSFFKFQTP